MQHDPVRTADTRGWLRKALIDLQAGEFELGGDVSLAADAVFHAQQAVEKSMKGFLAWHDRPFRKTHELEEIGEACLAIDPSLRELVDRAVPLTEYAWKFRYPGEIDEPTRQEAQDALAIARDFYEAILARLPLD